MYVVFLKNKGVDVFECEKEALSDVPGEKYNDKKYKYFWGFLKCILYQIVEEKKSHFTSSTWY